MTTRIHDDVQSLLARLDGAVRLEGDGVEVHDADAIRTELIDELAWTATFGSGDAQEAARWLIRMIAPAVGAYTASIHDLYMAAARNEYRNVTTPAINVRGDTVEFARTILKAAQGTDTKQVIFELAKSENTYTLQTPAEFATSILAAAIKVGWQGPVFIQGDHFQANRKKYASDPQAEIAAVRKHAREAIRTGYGNIDIDSSTLVDLSFEALSDQQRPNYVHTAELTAAVREAEYPGVTISVGGEIGEVGTTNSTVEDLDAFMEGYQQELAKYGDMPGLSKISVQTGTEHGGTVMPDGTIADVAVDFETLGKLSEAAKAYGMGGSVQHGASTLPEEAFGKFAQANAVEVHLATAYQNAYFDSEHFPADLKEQIYGWLSENAANERKDGQTDAQFFYTTRKRGFGPFKKELWSLPQETKDAIYGELQPRYELVMRELGVAGRSDLIEKYIKPIDIAFEAPEALRKVAKA